MISSAIVKEQLDAYLSQLMPAYSPAQRKADPISVDPDSIVKLVEDHMKKLRDLIDSECKKMYVDYARDCNMMIDGLLRCVISFCQNPENGLDTDRITSSYGNLRESFMEKYRAFFSNEFEETESVFFSLNTTLEELKTESTSLYKRLETTIQLKTETNSEKSTAQSTIPKEETKAKAPEEIKKQEGSQKAEGGWISRLMNKFKPSGETYIKCKLEESGTGMRYDPVKKRLAFFIQVDLR